MARSRFRGSEEVKVDAKGRVSIPAKFRRVFEACDDDWGTGKRARLVIVFGTRDWKHLQLFTMQAMEEIDQQISELPRGSAERNLLENIYYGHAEETEIDNDGRLVLPQKLRDRIGLSDSAFFISSGDSLKVWSPTNYEAQESALEDLVPNFEPGADPLSLLSSAPKAEA
ncbi:MULTISPECIES: division/cell wall cluster transcriptional repressor MraZ [Paracoccus]|uniref:Transcriptional regulator MraZ n=1 Tax=Paracoccus litorisediminis TaxID=2006130 RepID=A0A844HIU2_9RHOB|nr:division/cell wall cluster transcriptional repressor MraZ [Paracoccus sp. PAR01]MTH58374.1 division/cell wall cluster transcriptional repressor MraZ [Paracoccus litorisediminis]